MSEPLSTEWQNHAEMASGVITRCAAHRCYNIALQECSRCGRNICNQHAQPIEADLPSRWYLPKRPEWLCAACAEYATLRVASDRH
ncbi:MAG TPA: hypothetical protein VKQ36_11550 [Ktedonobacterales bacterium]|nr:hypothetical protein [Ktedonobacterales bacterium]